MSAVRSNTQRRPAAPSTPTLQPKPQISLEEWEAKAPLSDLALKSVAAIKAASEKSPLPLKVSTGRFVAMRADSSHSRKGPRRGRRLAPTHSQFTRDDQTRVRFPTFHSRFCIRAFTAFACPGSQGAHTNASAVL